MDELKALLQQHRFWTNKGRINLAPPEGVETKYGRPLLKEGVHSNVVRLDKLLPGPRGQRHRRMIELVQGMLGEHITDLCLNRNLVCPPHRDLGNTT